MTVPLRASSSQTAVAHVALVSITVTTRAVVYSEARCPNCHRRVMSVPGTPHISVNAVANDDARSGRGRVVGCARCKTLCEIVEHAR